MYLNPRAERRRVCHHKRGLRPFTQGCRECRAVCYGGVIMSRFDVCALGELLIDFTENGTSPQGNPIMEANPGGAPCNVLAMLN